MTDQEPRNGVICNVRHHIVKEAWLILEHVGIFLLSSPNILAEFVALYSMPEHLKEDVSPKIVNRKVDDDGGKFDVSRLVPKVAINTVKRWQERFLPRRAFGVSIKGLSGHLAPSSGRYHGMPEVPEA
jgi:hypothetical protein